MIFVDDELFFIDFFKAETRQKTIEKLWEVRELIDKDEHPFYTEFISDLIYKLSRINDDEFKKLDLESYMF